MDFKFDKPFYSERELLKIIPIKRSTFSSWQSEWLAKGKDPKEMGKLLLKLNSKSKRPIVYWNAPKYLAWLEKYKINVDPQFDYEYHNKQIAVAVVKGVKQNGN